MKANIKLININMSRGLNQVIYKTPCENFFAIFSQETLQFAFELIQLIFVNAGYGYLIREP